MKTAPGAAVLLLATAPLAFTQQPGELPSAASLFERYIAATGGQGAYDRIQNQTVVRTFRKDGEVLISISTVQTRSGNFRAVVTAGGQTREIGRNEGVVWTKMHDTADILESGDDYDAVLHDAVLLPESQWRTFFTDAETVDVDTVDGKACYVVAALPFAGPQVALWYDQKTGLLLKEVVEGSQGETTYVYGDYSNAGGISLPKTATVTMQGVTMLATIDSLEFDQPLPETTFALPAEVERLLKKQAASSQ